MRQTAHMRFWDQMRYNLSLLIGMVPFSHVLEINIHRKIQIKNCVDLDHTELFFHIRAITAENTAFQACK